MKSKRQKDVRVSTNFQQTYAVMEMFAADMGLTSFTSMAF